MNLKRVSLSIKLVPVTWLVLTLGVAGYFIGGYYPLYSHFLIKPLHLYMDVWDYLRLLSPTFLHFGIVHILFNAMGIWVLGSRIEVYCGLRIYLFLFLFIAIGANLIQFYLGESENFGGLSGVVYGYVGFLFIANRVTKHPLLLIPNTVFFVVLIFLLLGFTNVYKWVLGAGVANGAHLGGLLLGVIYGIGYFYRSFYRAPE